MSSHLFLSSVNISHYYATDSSLQRTEGTRANRRPHARSLLLGQDSVLACDYHLTFEIRRVGAWYEDQNGMDALEMR